MFSLNLEVQIHGNMAIITPSSCLWTSNKMNVISCRGRTLSKGKEGRNLYKVLRLESENVGFDEIKKAYRAMVLQWHPDVCHASKREESTRKFLELKQAYETLSDPLSRMKYDAQLHSGSSTEQPERSFCSKQVWEAQLSELKRRSNERLQRKNKKMLV